MIQPKFAAAVLIAVFVAGIAAGHASAQVPPSVGVRIYPKRVLTEDRLKVLTGETSAWYYVVQSRYKPSGGSWSQWTTPGRTIYIDDDMGLVCAWRYTDVLTLPGTNYVGQFRITQYYNSGYSTVYDCGVEDAMLYEYNPTVYDTAELSNGQAEDVDYYYDDT